MKKTALLIIGHGSKSSSAVKEFEEVVDCIRAKGQYEKVLGAHLEFAFPTIEQAVLALFNEHFLEIIVVPYFLYDGRHTRIHIPRILQEINKTYPDIVFKFARHIGFEPIMADILIKRANEAR